MTQILTCLDVLPKSLGPVTAFTFIQSLQGLTPYIKTWYYSYSCWYHSYPRWARARSQTSSKYKHKAIWQSREGGFCQHFTHGRIAPAIVIHELWNKATDSSSAKRSFFRLDLAFRSIDEWLIPVKSSRYEEVLRCVQSRSQNNFSQHFLHVLDLTWPGAKPF